MDYNGPFRPSHPFWLNFPLGSVEKLDGILRSRGLGNLDFKPFKIGKYLLLERLATGGMAEVYRAKASGAGGFEKQLAIKRILPTYSANEEFRRMFEYEARLSSMLTHANIVQVYDFVKSGDTYLLALEYIDGKNLRQFVNKARKIGFSPPVEFGVYVINEVCKGLDYAHKKKDDLNGKPLNIIHRDMSPQNIMLSYDGAVKIVDFGIAKAKDRVDETRSGVIKGKFGYMSPEQANGEPVDHRTDIFSTAIILYELLTNKRLFASESDMQTLKQIQECVIPPPSRINPKISADLEKILMKGLTKDLSLRYQQAGLFHRNLQEHLNKYYPQLTQKEAADILMKTFAEEIAAEKKRFEQIHRQSIPFSQGSKDRQRDQEDHGDDDPVDGELTKSEKADRTGVTYVPDEGSIDPSFEDGSFSIGSQLREGTQPEDDKDGRTKVEPDFDDSNSATPTRDSGALEDLVDNSHGTSEATGGTKMKGQKPAPGKRPAPKPTQEKTGSWEEKTRTNVTGPTENTDAPSASDIVLDDFSQSGSNRRRDRSISALTEMSASGADKPLDLERNDTNATRVKVDPAPAAKPRNKTTGRVIEAPDYLPTEKPKNVVASFAKLFVAMALLYVAYEYWFAENPISNPRPPASNPSGQTVPQTKNPPPVEINAPPPPVTTYGDCTLNLSTDPPGARVFVDGVDRGVSTTISAECGANINLEVRMDGFDSVSENVVLKSKNTKLTKVLKRVPSGTLELTLNRNAKVYIGDDFLGEIGQGFKFEKVLRANRKYRLRFVNEVLGIDELREVEIKPDILLRKNVRLGEGSKE